MLVLPVTAMLAMFPAEFLLVWTGDADTAARARALVAPLALGYALQALTHVSWALQLAHGWLRLSATVTTSATVVFIPMLIVMAREWGAPGGALAWALMSLGYVAAGQVAMHRRLLTGELASWISRDIGRPAVVSVAVCLVGRMLIEPGWPRPALLAALGAVASTATALAALSLPDIRASLVAMFRRDARWAGPSETGTPS